MPASSERRWLLSGCLTRFASVQRLATLPASSRAGRNPDGCPTAVLQLQPIQINDHTADLPGRLMHISTWLPRLLPYVIG